MADIEQGKDVERSKEPTRIVLNDPRSMRAYAHPLRLRLVALLRRLGPHTATQAAEALGETVPNCSFHLRQLAKYGFVERVEGADNRERPWRAAQMATSWDNDSPQPEMRAAADHLTGVMLNRYMEMAGAWLSWRERDSAAWRAVTGIADQTLHVTPEELTAVTARIDEVLRPYVARQLDPALRPPGARAINFVEIVMPWDPPEGDAASGAES